MREENFCYVMKFLHEQSRPHRRTTNTGVLCLGVDGVEYYGIVEEIYELDFYGDKPMNPVVFKCHWFDPSKVRRTPDIGLVEIQQSTVLPGDDVFIVAQQATQVYYLSYPCQTMDHIKGWDVVYKVSPHGKLPVPNNEDYNIDPNTYEGEFFQEDGLSGGFTVELQGPEGMEVDNEQNEEEDEEEEVYNEKDLQMLAGLDVGNADDIPPPDHPDDYVDDTRDSDDETFDPADPNDDDYF